MSLLNKELENLEEVAKAISVLETYQAYTGIGSISQELKAKLGLSLLITKSALKVKSVLEAYDLEIRYLNKEGVLENVVFLNEAANIKCLGDVIVIEVLK